MWKFKNNWHIEIWKNWTGWGYEPVVIVDPTGHWVIDVGSSHYSIDHKDIEDAKEATELADRLLGSIGLGLSRGQKAAITRALRRKGEAKIWL